MYCLPQSPTPRTYRGTSVYLTMRETCARLRLSRWTVRRRIDAGELTAHKGPGRSGRLRIEAASVVAYETRHTISPPVPVLAEVAVTA